MDGEPSKPLLAGTVGGDSRALASLLVLHLPSLEAYVRLKTGPALRARESLSDVVQSVCVEVLRDAEQFEYRGEAQFRQWLFRQALHKIVNKGWFHVAAKRDRRREAGRDGSAGSSYADCYRTLLTPSRDAIGREQCAALESAIDQLPDDYREAVLLRRIVGLGYPEIAEAMGRSEGAVRNLVYRGIARLSSLLDDRESRG